MHQLPKKADDKANHIAVDAHWMMGNKNGDNLPYSRQLHQKGNSPMS